MAVSCFQDSGPSRGFHGGRRDKRMDVYMYIYVYYIYIYTHVGSVQVHRAPGQK